LQTDKIRINCPDLRYIFYFDSTSYGTFKLSDTYSVQLVKDLLEKSKENVRKNKEKIIRTIKEVVG
jgi:hypothetical protein